MYYLTKNVLFFMYFSCTIPLISMQSKVSLFDRVPNEVFSIILFNVLYPHSKDLVRIACVSKEWHSNIFTSSFFREKSEAHIISIKPTVIFTLAEYIQRNGCILAKSSPSETLTSVLEKYTVTESIDHNKIYFQYFAPQTLRVDKDDKHIFWHKGQLLVGVAVNPRTTFVYNSTFMLDPEDFLQSRMTLLKYMEQLNKNAASAPQDMSLVNPLTAEVIMFAAENHINKPTIEYRLKNQYINIIQLPSPTGGYNAIEDGTIFGFKEREEDFEFEKRQANILHTLRSAVAMRRHTFNRRRFRYSDLHDKAKIKRFQQYTHARKAKSTKLDYTTND
jgi:hypothetical protein